MRHISSFVLKKRFNLLYIASLTIMSKELHNAKLSTETNKLDRFKYPFRQAI